MRHTWTQLNTRLLALAVALVLMLLSAPSALAADSGECGDGLTWTFSDGVLTITGSGAMTDYSQNDLPPWYDRREEIFRLQLPEGLTSVGAMAFYDCTELTAVILPTTVEKVGQLAFCQNRSLAVLNLNPGLASIGRSAFEQCESLHDLRLPDGLTTLAYHAFYLCTGLTHATVPASVTDMGSGVFAYCKSLVRVEMNARLDALPPWTFYGCENLDVVKLPASVKKTEENAFARCESLSTIDYSGTSGDGTTLKQSIVQDHPVFSMGGVINTTGQPTAASAGDAKLDENGVVSLSTTTVTSTKNATVSSTVTENRRETTAKADITASVVATDGWDEVVQQVRSAETVLKQKKAEGAVLQETGVTAYVSGEAQVPQTVLAALAGMDACLTVQTDSGARFSVDCSQVKTETLESGADFSYDLTTPEGEESLGGDVYRLEFGADMKINAEVMVKLPRKHAGQTAYLYQKLRGEPELLQTVVIDHNGYAHFYLGSVESGIEYLVGVNVPNGDAAAAIIPQELYAEYGITDTRPQVEYVLTGRKSSWGMSIRQVTWIMVGAMTILVVMVGVTMYLLNKRKLRMGYVPVLDEEDE